jgi:hypothetical protein
MLRRRPSRCFFIQMPKWMDGWMDRSFVRSYRRCAFGSVRRIVSVPAVVKIRFDEIRGVEVDD